jgi:hypothetical protein
MFKNVIFVLRISSFGFTDRIMELLCQIIVLNLIDSVNKNGKVVPVLN